MLKLYAEREKLKWKLMLLLKTGESFIFMKLEVSDIILMRMYEGKRGLGFQTNEVILNK